MAKELQKIEHTIGIEANVEVQGYFTPATVGTYYRSNGDPGDPPEESEFEITKILFYGVDITNALEKSEFDFRALEEDILNKNY